MKRQNSILSVVVVVMFTALLLFAANVSFQAFNTSQFFTDGRSVVDIKTGALVTNWVDYGTFQVPNITGGGGQFLAVDAFGNITAGTPASGGGFTGNPLQFTVNSGTTNLTSSLFVNSLTASNTITSSNNITGYGIDNELHGQTIVGPDSIVNYGMLTFNWWTNDGTFVRPTTNLPVLIPQSLNLNAANNTASNEVFAAENLLTGALGDARYAPISVTEPTFGTQFTVGASTTNLSDPLKVGTLNVTNNANVTNNMSVGGTLNVTGVSTLGNQTNTGWQAIAGNATNFGAVTVVGGLTIVTLSPSALAATGAGTNMVSIANGTGFLNDNGSGTFSYSQNAQNLTNFVYLATGNSVAGGTIASSGVGYFPFNGTGPNTGPQSAANKQPTIIPIQAPYLLSNFVFNIYSTAAAPTGSNFVYRPFTNGVFAGFTVTLMGGNLVGNVLITNDTTHSIYFGDTSWTNVLCWQVSNTVAQTSINISEQTTAQAFK